MITIAKTHGLRTSGPEYVLREAVRLDPGRTGKWTALWNCGLDEIASFSFAAACAVMRACGRSVRKLKKPFLHAVFSPPPSSLLVDRQYELLTEAFIASMHALEIPDRVALTALHPPANEGGVYHLHAFVALPDPLTGKSISHHGMQQKIQRAAKPFEKEFLAAPLRRSISVPEHVRDLEADGHEHRLPTPEEEEVRHDHLPSAFGF
ncbi:hypothetical protein NUH88_15875 [Nisaea acidiphila]|uniref:Uncharacterized protein n=1 Tax=Nisaea acidiphila TaxID=1862145 RepID=A0A9J7AQK0_9PROT|nr:hypothetical protein [Nisaea acidiphila]UUX48873.1 hypothetical protein NUH88_15875 [Nisaea acidiphila]